MHRHCEIGSVTTLQYRMVEFRFVRRHLSQEGYSYLFSLPLALPIQSQTTR